MTSRHDPGMESTAPAEFLQEECESEGCTRPVAHKDDDGSFWCKVCMKNRESVCTWWREDVSKRNNSHFGGFGTESAYWGDVGLDDILTQYEAKTDNGDELTNALDLATLDRGGIWWPQADGKDVPERVHAVRFHHGPDFVEKITKLLESYARERGIDPAWVTEKGKAYVVTPYGTITDGTWSEPIALENGELQDQCRSIVSAVEDNIKDNM